MSAVPTTVRLRHAGVVKTGLKPFVSFNMAVGKCKHGGSTMLVAGNVINIVAIHVHPKLWTTNAVGMKLAEYKYVSGSLN